MENKPNSNSNILELNKETSYKERKEEYLKGKNKIIQPIVVADRNIKLEIKFV